MARQITIDSCVMVNAGSWAGFQGRVLEIGQRLVAVEIEGHKDRAMAVIEIPMAHLNCADTYGTDPEFP
jgi:ribosomal protein L24